MNTHKLTIIGNRPSDNSLIYKCLNCNKIGIGLIGPCKKNENAGRRIKVIKNLA
jgi:hypothetical protein